MKQGDPGASGLKDIVINRAVPKRRQEIRLTNKRVLDHKKVKSLYFISQGAQVLLEFKVCTSQ